MSLTTYKRTIGCVLSCLCLLTSVPTSAGPDANQCGLEYKVPLSTHFWTTLYDGYGSVTYDLEKGIVLSPKVSTSPWETHAALAFSNVSLLKNFRVTITATTEAQLRQNSTPNVWEVFWVLFNYVPTATGKATNYFILKPNGVELGIAYDNDLQTFLQTGPTTATALGVSNRIEIEKIDNRVVVYVNGVKVTDFTGAVIDAPGSIGLYSEDARVRITGYQVTPL